MRTSPLSTARNALGDIMIIGLITTTLPTLIFGRVKALVPWLTGLWALYFAILFGFGLLTLGIYMSILWERQLIRWRYSHGLKRAITADERRAYELLDRLKQTQNYLTRQLEVYEDSRLPDAQRLRSDYQRELGETKERIDALSQQLEELQRIRRETVTAQVTQDPVLDDAEIAQEEARQLTGSLSELIAARPEIYGSSEEPLVQRLGK